MPAIRPVIEGSSKAPWSVFQRTGYRFALGKRVKINKQSRRSDSIGTETALVEISQESHNLLVGARKLRVQSPKQKPRHSRRGQSGGVSRTGSHEPLIRR